ncbi:hypothetical protein U732_4346 [Clostridium argentinense CDC 2741]|uniref:Uncharacterized protein n=1 Tax=Clostridium argentinense CDC 2741 TaxID=1418104 RepID=A0A0C1RDZ1_9CLOT|nr:hypothetical protein U732_4346 [Clostridium argentinense CDC 2741]
MLNLFTLSQLKDNKKTLNKNLKSKINIRYMKHLCNKLY